jgi:hypothetical protein
MNISTHPKFVDKDDSFGLSSKSLFNEALFENEPVGELMDRIYDKEVKFDLKSYMLSGEVVERTDIDINSSDIGSKQ